MSEGISRKFALRYVLVGVLVVSMLVTGYLVFSMFNTIANEQSRVPPTTVYTGRSALDSPQPLENFTLASNNGTTSLSDFRGKPTLLFFGYTHCPDVCPVTLAEFKRVKVELDDFGNRVNFVFISVDPQRDSPAVSAEYVSKFDPDFIGLSGDEVTLRRIAPEYGLQFEYDTSSGSETEYLVNHTGYSYLIDPEGRLTVRYDYGTDVEYLIDDVRAMLAGMEQT